MAYFCARRTVAFEQLAVDYYAAAYARAESDEYAVFIVLARAEFRLAEGRRIGVVGDFYRDAYPFFQLACKGIVAQIEVARKHQNAVFAVDYAGAADAHVRVFLVDAALFEH